MLVKDLVRFNRENYYNGAVQTDWFYDKSKVKNIAQSYVFHGPKYYGVSDKDVKSGEHKLIDTASFSKIVVEKLYEKEVENNFVLTIAGYGTGKSHLAVTLGALLSGNSELQKAVVKNIASVDSQIASEIEKRIGKNNLVIALNGMKNFNLDAEVLSSVRLALEQNGESDDVLKSLTKTYDVAKYFINENYEKNIELFETAAEQVGIKKQGNSLKNYLEKNIESDPSAIDIVNVVFKKVTGDSLHWEQGVSAGDIILKVSKELCGEGKPFNKVLILFDEFGRYIEYVAANPVVAGDASLQQIFEAVQSSEGNAVFVGFVQYELEAYLTHIDKTSNVIRYVGRYSASEKYYLSSNFETILANLLEKQDEGRFTQYIGKALDRYVNFHKKVHSALDRWTDNSIQKNVWKSDALYRKVIMEGCYPLHPITVWLLSNSSGWMQQRSTIAFCAEMFEDVSDQEISNDWLPYVYPVDIIDSGIYSEMLNSEEKGLVKSQNCMLYNEIIVKIGDKLTDEESQILKAVLIARIAGFKFHDKEEAFTAFRYFTNLREEAIKPAVKNLEDRHGVIAYDDQAKTYDLIAEANGFNEFKRVFARYRTGNSAVIDDMDEDLMKELGLTDPVDTAFGQDNHISSMEWKFEKELVSSDEIDKAFLDSAIRNVDSANDGEAYRGLLLYAYCSEDTENEINRLAALYNSLEMDKVPIIILFLDDSEGEILRALTVKKTMLRFSLADNERFSKHLMSQKRSQNKKIIHTFNTMVMERKRISGEGLLTYDVRLNMLCSRKFAEVYSTPVPFAFDGFESKRSVQAKKTFSTLCIKMFDQTLMNVQSYQALNTADKNRVQSCLSVAGNSSWKVFNKDCQLVLPQNELIKKIYSEVDSSIPEEGSFTVGRLFGKYLHAPYGMNIYSYTLFVIYFIQKHENKLVCFLGNEKLSASNLNSNILKDGKLKFSELQRITIQRNHNMDVDVVAEICNEILENTDVNKCGVLRKRLSDTIRVEGGSPQNQIAIGQAEMRLDDGDRIKNRLDDRQIKIKQYLDDALAKMVIHKFVGVFDYLQAATGVIEEGLPYTYSSEYVEFMGESISRVGNFLGAPFEKALTVLRCPDITQLSSFKNAYSRVVKVLREQGYDKQADAAETRVEEVEAEIKARNQYNQALGECEKDIAINNDVSKYSYGECDSVASKLEGWKKFFAETDMPTSLSAPLLEKVEELLKRVDGRKKEILSEVSEMENDISSAETLDDLLSATDSAENLLLDNLPEEIEEKIKNIISAIYDLRSRVDNLPDSIDELEVAENYKDGESVYDQVYSAEAASKKAKLIRKEEEWIRKVIIPVEEGEELDAQKCTSMIEKLHNIPDFVSKGTVARAREALDIVDKKLHECKVQGVLSLYNSLTEEEKEEFKSIISKQ